MTTQQVTQQLLIASSSRNEQLLKTLAETDDAGPATEQSAIYIEDLSFRIAEEMANLTVLTAKFAKERPNMRSIGKRLAYKLSGNIGKFETEASKEDQEYIEALQARFQAEQRLNMLKTNLEKAQSTRAEREKAYVTHQEAQAELDTLYNSIFDGPNPGFPEEDAAEERLRQAQVMADKLQRRVAAETYILDLLKDAAEQFVLADVSLQDGRGACKEDMWGSGLFTQLVEKDAMNCAQSHVSQAETLVSMAREIQPKVKSIGEVNIPQPSFRGDFIYNNTFSDTAFCQQIEVSRDTLKKVQAKLGDELTATRVRQGTWQSEHRVAKLTLENARAQLQRVRQEVFQRSTAKGGSQQLSASSGLPPSYDQLSEGSQIAAPPLVQSPFDDPPSYYNSSDIPEDIVTAIAGQRG